MRNSCTELASTGRNARVDALKADAADPDAVNNYATLGETMTALADVFGRHTEVPTI